MILLLISGTYLTQHAVTKLWGIKLKENSIVSNVESMVIHRMNLYFCELRFVQGIGH